MFRDQQPITAAEASAGRCELCHRKLLAHPRARVQDIERLGNEWGAGLVHRSCAVLAGFKRPGASRRRDEPQPVL